MRAKNGTIYALYKGEELIDIGTIIEIADRMGVTHCSIYALKCPSYLSRKHKDNRRVLVKIEEPKPKKKKPKKKKPRKPKYIKKPPKIYNLYKYGKLIATDTMQNLADYVNVSKYSLKTYNSPKYKKEHPYTKYKLEKVKG